MDVRGIGVRFPAWYISLRHGGHSGPDAHPASYRMDTEAFSGLKWPGVKLLTHLHLRAESKNGQPCRTHPAQIIMAR
jgi:hypothetical protein